MCLFVSDSLQRTYYSTSARCFKIADEKVLLFIRSDATALQFRQNVFFLFCLFKKKKKQTNIIGELKLHVTHTVN